jgi:hypothetical protein
MKRPDQIFVFVGQRRKDIKSQIRSWSEIVRNGGDEKTLGIYLTKIDLFAFILQRLFVFISCLRRRRLVFMHLQRFTKTSWGVSDCSRRDKTQENELVWEQRDSYLGWVQRETREGKIIIVK